MPFTLNHLFAVVFALLVIYSASACSAQSGEPEIAGAWRAINAGWYDTALEVVQRLAQQGSADGNCTLALMYQHGLGVRKNHKLARKCMQACENRAPQMFMLTNIAGTYHGKRKYAAPQAVEVAAKAGDRDACFNLGLYYFLAERPQRNLVDSVKWFELAGQKNDADARTNMGFMYHFGLGAAADPTKAVRLYEQAAADGQPVAMNNLGCMYASATGVERNDRKAVRLFQSAIMHGNVDALINLAFMYENGFGVEQSTSRAAKLLMDACSAGVICAEYNLHALYGRHAQLYARRQELAKQLSSMEAQMAAYSYQWDTFETPSN